MASNTNQPQLGISFKGRVLQEPAISLQSCAGVAMIAKVLNKQKGSIESTESKIHEDKGGVENIFITLISHLRTQDNPSFCGLGSLVTVLNSLNIDPGRPWQVSVWRYYEETMLGCCVPIEIIRKKGMSLDQFACLASCNGLYTQLFRPVEHPSDDPNSNKSVTKISLDEFRDAVRQCTSRGTKLVMVISYSRTKVNQSGGGHFAPIAAYEEDTDMVLILEVARFKYPSHWLPLQAVYKAMEDIDPESKKSRGFVIMSSHADNISITNLQGKEMSPHRCVLDCVPLHAGALFVICPEGDDWLTNIQIILDMNLSERSVSDSSACDILSTIGPRIVRAKAPSASIIESRLQHGDNESEILHNNYITQETLQRQIITQLRGTALYSLIQRSSPVSIEGSALSDSAKSEKCFPSTSPILELKTLDVAVVVGLISIVWRYGLRQQVQSQETKVKCCKNIDIENESLYESTEAIHNSELHVNYLYEKLPNELQTEITSLVAQLDALKSHWTVKGRML